jgi:hypothetical protein
VECALQGLGRCGAFARILAARLPSLGTLGRREPSGPLGYELLSWPVLGPAAPPRALPAPLVEARSALFALLERERSNADAAAAAQAWSAGVPADRQARLDAFERATSTNLGIVRDALDRCHDLDPAVEAELATCVDGATRDALRARGYDPDVSLDDVFR